VQVQDAGRRTRSSDLGRRITLKKVSKREGDGELDYLVDAGKLGSSSSEAMATSQSESQRAPDSGPLAAFAARLVLQTVSDLEKKAVPPGSGVRLSECSEQIHMSAEVIVPLTAGLEGVGLLTVLERDPFGNHLVATTPSADELLAAEDPIRMLRALGLE
jgi:hypothetical protein